MTSPTSPKDEKSACFAKAGKNWGPRGQFLREIWVFSARGHGENRVVSTSEPSQAGRQGLSRGASVRGLIFPTKTDWHDEEPPLRFTQKILPKTGKAKTTNNREPSRKTTTRNQQASWLQEDD